MGNLNMSQSPPKKGLNISNPSGAQILTWLAHIAGYRILPLKPEKIAGQIEPSAGKQLLQVTQDDWEDIHLAAQFSNGLAEFKPMEETCERLQRETGFELDGVVPFDTGLSVGRKAVLFRVGRRLILTFEATKPNEMKMNAWSHAKDPEKKWSLPYARYLDGRQVHSFFLDMWLGMREEIFKEITKMVRQAEEQGDGIERFLITGHSMGGGISVLALIDIVEHLRQTFGTPSASPRPWCTDPQLTHLIRHVTFADFASAGTSYTAHLNDYYSLYNIPAWDFVHPHDFTTRLHLPFFRTRRGHRYVLPKEAVKGFEKEYAAGRHDMPGYLKSMEWMQANPRTLRSLYA